MGEHTIDVDAIATHRTLTPGEVDTVTVARQVDQVSVTVWPGGSEPVWVTADGTDPEPGGARSRPVWPGYAAILPGGLSARALDGLAGDIGEAPTVIKLVSVGAQSYTVET